MYVELKTLLYDGETHYLQNEELNTLKSHIDSLKTRLETYKALREEELNIFQAIGLSLQESFPGENEKVLAEALKHWISVMRYCSMAMMLNSSEFLQTRLLEWLAPVVAASEWQEIENKISQTLVLRLKYSMKPQQLQLILPFVEEAQTTLLGQKNQF